MKRGGVDIFNKQFYGKINNHTLSDMYTYIDYDLSSLNDRLTTIEDAMEVGFFQEYFDTAYTVHPNKKDPLSENDNVCICLERMADYILSCDEEITRKKSENEYIYFNSRNHLKKKLNKELSFSNMLPESKTFQDVILNNIMEDDVGRIALPKVVEIKDDDFEGDSDMARYLRDYLSIINSIDSQESSNNKIKSLQKFHLRKDMETIKRCFTGVEEYKHDNLNNLPQTTRGFDLTDESVVYGFTTSVQGKNRFVQGLLFYNKPEGLDINDPLSVALHDIDKCLETSERIDSRDRRLIYMLRQGVSRKSVAKALKIDTSTVSRQLKKITNIIREECKYGNE